MRFLLPFTDDSCAIFAGRMGRELTARGFDTRYVRLIDRRGRDLISDRQIAQHLRGAPYREIEIADLGRPEAFEGIDVVVFCKVPEVMQVRLADEGYRARTDRPCFVGFQPGLEMTPMKGFESRRNLDVYFTAKQADAEEYRRTYPFRPGQHLSWGHPYAVRSAERAGGGGRNVYFFAQAISPRTRASRAHIVRVLAAIARANPDRTVFIKLRHLPGENARHVHKEEFDYPGLLAAMDRPPPDNLQLTDGSMDEALADAGVAITCTSTAAIDALAAGVPTAVYLDYVDHFFDPLRPPMYRTFLDSGVITSLPDLLELRISPPDEAWMSAHFRGPDLYDEMIEAIGRFRRDPTTSPSPSATLVPGMGPA